MIAVDPNDPKGIVWIASYPKSGNTWVRIFLHHVVRQAAGRPLEDNELEELRRTSRAPFGRPGLYERFLGKPVTQADPQEIAVARPQAQRALMEESDGIVFAKTHSFLGQVFDQPLINSAVSAGAIYIVRNPLDIAVSLAFYYDEPFDKVIHSMGASLNATLTTEVTVQEIWGSWTENVASWTSDPPPVILTVRYEDLVADPASEFRRIVAHMNLDVTEEQIDEAIRLSSFKRLREQEEKGGFSERPVSAERFFREGKAGVWRDRLSAEQVDRIVADHGEQMGRFGYLPAN